MVGNRLREFKRELLDEEFAALSFHVHPVADEEEAHSWALNELESKPISQFLHWSEIVLEEVFNMWYV